MIRINSNMVATVALVALALQAVVLLNNQQQGAQAKPMKKNANQPSYFNDNAEASSDNDANNKFEFMSEAELEGRLNQANSDIDEDTQRNNNNNEDGSGVDDDESQDSPAAAASHKKPTQRNSANLNVEESVSKSSERDDNGPINEFSGNDREEHDKNMNSDISEAVGGGSGQGESASASDESADQADEPMSNEETSNLDNDDDSSASPVPVEHPRARAAASRPQSATRLSMGYGLESRPSTQLTGNKKQARANKQDESSSNDDDSVEQRDPMSRIVDRGDNQEQDSADSKAMYTSTDLKAAASGHHKHGHGVSGWLDMGAHSGKKGSYGWHDKHPVGGKGKK